MRELGMWVFAHAMAFLREEPKRDEKGLGAVEWAIITALSVLIAFLVYRGLSAVASDAVGGIEVA